MAPTTVSLLARYRTTCLCKIMSSNPTGDVTDSLYIALLLTISPPIRGGAILRLSSRQTPLSLNPSTNRPRIEWSASQDGYSAVRTACGGRSARGVRVEPSLRSGRAFEFVQEVAHVDSNGGLASISDEKSLPRATLCPWGGRTAIPCRRGPLIWDKSADCRVKKELKGVFISLQKS